MKNIALILCCVAIIIAIFSTRGCMDRDATIASVNTMLSQAKDTALQYKTIAGKEHATRASESVKYEAVIASKDEDIINISSTLGVAKKQIENLKKIKLQDKGSFTTKVDTVKRTDTINGQIIVREGQHFKYEDQWMNEEGWIDSSQISINYSMNVDLITTDYWKRKWFLGRKRGYIDGYSNNPHVHITGLNGIKIKEKIPGRFGLGPYVGVNLTGNFSIGIALTYSLIRF